RPPPTPPLPSFPTRRSSDLDTINVGNGNLDNLPGAVAVNGETGTDRIVINDGVATFSDTYTITSTTVSRILFGGLTYGTAEQLVLNAETGSNLININSTLSSTPVTVNAGAGDDTINAGNGNLANLPGAVAVNGDAGTDLINVNDGSSASANTYAVTSAGVTRGGFGGLTYGTAEQLVLNGGLGGNTVNVQSTPATTPVTVNAGAGNDPINVGSGSPPPGSSTINGLLGALMVNGQGGTDLLNVNDQSNAPDPARVYTVTATSVSRSGPPNAVAPITYGTI